VYGSTLIKGRVTMNFEPSHSLDWTIISPPKAFAICLLTAKPRPTPSGLQFLFSSIFVKGVKSLWNLSVGIPTPESSTIIHIIFSELSIFALILIYPFWVYLIALEIRLMIIYFTLFPSVWIFQGKNYLS